MIGPQSNAVLVPDGSVLFPLRPYDDESYFSFLARLASSNCFENRRVLLRALGVENIGSGGFSEAFKDEGRLARCMGLTPEELGRLLWRELDEKCHKEFEWNPRKLAPRSLEEAPYHRRAWSIARLPYCPFTWDVLIDRCPACRARLTWDIAREVYLCAKCNFDLRLAKADTVPLEAREPLKFFADLMNVDPQSGMDRDSEAPALLIGERRSDVFKLIYSFASFIASGRSVWKFSGSPLSERVYFLEEAVNFLRDYPYCFDKLAEPSRGKEFPFVRRMRQRMQASPDVLRLLEKLLSDWEPCRHGIQRIKREREASDCLTVREAAEEMRVDNATVRKLVESGLLRPVNSRGAERRYDWLPKADVMLVARSLAQRMSLREFSSAYQLPVGAVLQLCSAGLISENRCQFVSLLHPLPQFNRADVDAFVDRLRARIDFAPHGMRTLSLQDVFHGIGGQRKPWSAFIQSALDRELKLYADEGAAGQLSIKDVRISEALSREVICGRRPDLLAVPEPSSDHLAQRNFTRGEVEQHLNCFPRDVGWLIGHGRLHPDFLAEQVDVLGRELISSREIAWRWRVSPAMRDRLGADHNIQRCYGPFWRRHDVESHFARMFPTGAPISN